MDVLVVGGGPAGVAAAFAAARHGAKTLIIEQFNCLGGVATSGGHGHMVFYSSWGTHEVVVGGIPFEIARRVADAGWGAFDHRASDFEVEGLKIVLEDMAAECGVQLLYHTFFSRTVVENGKAIGAVVQNKTGRNVILAKRIIDCTGDGDAAAGARPDAARMDALWVQHPPQPSRSAKQPRGHGAAGPIHHPQPIFSR